MKPRTAHATLALLLAWTLSLPVFATEYWVATGGADSSGRGTSSDAPFKTLTYALTVAKNAGDVVHVGAGTFSGESGWTVNADVTIEGAGEGSTKITSSKEPTVNSSGAVIRNLTLSSADKICACVLNNGTITNCTITGASASNTLGARTLKQSGGLVVDCRIYSNHSSGSQAGSGNKDAPVKLSGSATIRDTIFYDNYRGYGWDGTGADWAWSGAGAVDIETATAGQTVSLENCTFTRNRGFRAGALSIVGGAGNVRVTGCVIAGNHSYYDNVSRGTIGSDDIYVSKGSGSILFKNTLIGSMPTGLDAALFEDCWCGTAPGFVDELTGDYTLQPGSPAYGFGYHAATAPDGFACAVETPSVDRANGSIELTLKAKLFNKPEGEATYEWDLDGDGTYETTGGATQPAAFTTPGWHCVGLRVTVGDVSVSSELDPIALVIPDPIIVRQAKKGQTPAFPYATEATAANSLLAAYNLAIDGSRIRVMAGSVSLDAHPLNKQVEIYGDQRDTAILTGAARSESARCFDGSFLHDLTFSGGYPVLCVDGLSVVSNCIVQNGSMSTATATGLRAYDGLVTHCIIRNNTSSNGDGVGAAVARTGVLRNSIIQGNHFSSATAGTCNAPVLVSGGTLENCTIYGNYAPAAAKGLCGGVHIAGAATIRNNIIWGNEAKNISDASDAAHNWLVDAGVSLDNVSNNCSPVALGSQAVTTDPGFASAGSDFSITSASSCYDKGLSQDWMKGATDFGGNERLQGKAVDIGAYEADASKLSFGFTASSTTLPGAQTVTFTVTGDIDQLEPGTQFNWDFDGDGVYELTTNVTTFAWLMPEGRPSITLKVGEYDPVTRTDAVDVKTETAYVVNKAANPVYPYNTWATAASTITAALQASASGSTVVVSNGTYSAENLGTVAIGVTIRGFGASRTDVVLDRNGNDYFLLLNHPDAVFENVTVKRSRDKCVQIGENGGTVRNVRLESSYGSTHTAVAINAVAGLIEDVEVYAPHNNSNSEGDGMAVILDGSAVLRNSIIRQDPANTSLYGDSVVLVKAGARMENAAIYGFYCRGCVVKNAGTVVNCVMAGNRSQDVSSAGAPDWSLVSGGVYSNCVATTSAGEDEGNLAGDPEFKNPDNGDFSFDAGSVCFNAGLNLDWTTADAKDFYGNVRLSGGTVDIGPFEADANQANVAISVDPKTGVGTTAVTFTAVPTGFEFDENAVFVWTITNELNQSETILNENAVCAQLGTGSYSVYLRVTNADGKGTEFHRKKLSIVTVYPTDLYVDPACENPVYPYETPETAATSIADVSPIIADGMTVHLAAGTHPVSKTLTVTTRTVFIGAGADTVLENASGVTNAVLVLQHGQSAASNMTIRAAGNPLVTITSSGGTVEGLTLTGAFDGSATAGAALRLLGGTARRCRITANACARSACPVYMAGVTILEDCLIDGNTSASDATAAAGGVYLAGGTVRNCTIVNNTASKNAGGLVLAPIKESGDYLVEYFATPIINTIVWGNACPSGLDNWSAEYTWQSRFSHCYCNPAVTVGSGNLGGADDPGFVDYAGGDYTLVGADAAVYNKGLYGAWMDAALDLSGASRLKDARFRRVDMGCYESPFVARGLLFLLK